MIAFLLGLSFNAYSLQQNTAQNQIVQQSQANEQNGRYFILDPESLNFVELQKTPETVDSLINYGRQERNRDARISYHVAREALALAKEIGYTEGEAQAHNLTGIQNLILEKALPHFN